MSSPSQKLTMLKAALDGTIENMPCFIAADDVNEYEILKNRPGTGKIAVGWSKSTARVNFPGGDITGRENQFLYATVSRGRGLNQTRSDNLIYGSGGGDALIALADKAVGLMRSCLFDPATDEPPDYIDSESLDIKVYGVDGIRIRIWVGSQRTNFSPTQLPVQTEPH